MAIADASQNRLLYKEEVTYATAPGGTYTEIRLVSESLGGNVEVVQSDEVVADRMPPDNIRVGISGGGDVPTEFSASTFDDWFEAVLMSAAWTTKVQQAVSCAQASSGGTSTLTRASGSFITDGYTANSWIRVSGSSQATNNNYFKIASVSATVLTLDRGPDMATQASESITIQQLSQIQNGATLRTFTIEREYSNLTNEFAQLLGFALQGFSMRARGKDKITINWNWIGRSEETKTSTDASGVTSAPQTKVYSVVSDIVMFDISGDPTAKFVNFEVNYANGLYLQDEEAGSLGPVGIGLGTISLSGRWDFYYRDGTIFTDYTAFSGKDMSVAIEDAFGNGYVLDILRNNFTNGRRATPGKDQAVKGQLDWLAAKDGIESLMIKICRTS